MAHHETPMILAQGTGKQSNRWMGRTGARSLGVLELAGLDDSHK